MKNNSLKNKNSGRHSPILKKIEEKLLKIAVEIAKEGDGALFVIGDGVKYDLLYRKKIKQFNLFSSNSASKILKLTKKDGAIIISTKGMVLDYGAMIKNTTPFIGYGTRHAAAVTASKGNNISILCSEEERKIKIFKNGKYVMQLDALEKNIKKEIHDIATMFESIGAGFLGTIGTAALAPAIGIALIPGVIVFGGSYYAIKTLLKKSKHRHN